ncbi:hypothetical protein F511_25626 [Dorcoceras hygrometricum]|uniref:Uncharacterized protein n=1 Tax=Dorcoceras hygrometricum TaxID=472368 RepID=A0A2Z7AHW7_9LAMI|nr:hypothetical protein F511_25626 [Dorcoceras hygrometricum]
MDAIRKACVSIEEDKDCYLDCVQREHKSLEIKTARNQIREVQHSDQTGTQLKFTREDLFTALNDMVHEYKKLSQYFEEVMAEKESHASKAELVSSSEMQAALSKLSNELRSRSLEMLNENHCLGDIMSSWTKSSASLDKFQGAMNPSDDRSELSYVRFCGMGYTAPEKTKESWIKKRVEQIRGQPKMLGKIQASSLKLLQRKGSTGLVQISAAAKTDVIRREGFQIRLRYG